jgi:uncharacterized membrane protein YkvA (DUF1232 family)
VSRHLSPEELEQRIQRLEDVVAQVCDSHEIEQRVRRAVAQLQTDGGQAIADLGTEDSARRSQSALAALLASGLGWEKSLLRDLWSDVTTFFQMIRDPLYSMTWTARVVPALALAYILWPWDLLPELSGTHFFSIPVICWLDDLFASYVGLKVLSRELRRYREFLAGQTGSSANRR